MNLWIKGLLLKLHVGIFETNFVTNQKTRQVQNSDSYSVFIMTEQEKVKKQCNYQSRKIERKIWDH